MKEKHKSSKMTYPKGILDNNSTENSNNSSAQFCLCNVLPFALNFPFYYILNEIPF